MITLPGISKRDGPAIARHAADVMPGPRDSVTRVICLASEAMLAQRQADTGQIFHMDQIDVAV